MFGFLGGWVGEGVGWNKVVGIWIINIYLNFLVKIYLFKKMSIFFFL